MNRLLELLFSRKKLFLMLSGLVLAFGIYSYIVIPKQNMPDIDTPYMAIQVVAPGVSASYLEDRAVSDMEKVILTFQDVMEVNTTIYDNVAIIFVLFSYDTDNPDTLANDIFLKLNDLELDESVTSLSYDSGFDDPHIIFSVHSNTLSATELHDVATEYKNELLTIDDIQTVEIDSPNQEQVVITLNPTVMQLYGLSITDLYRLLEASTMNIPLGGISTVYGTISVSGFHDFDSISELEEFIVIPEIPTVTPEITLSDLGTIALVDSSSTLYTFDQEPTVFLSVYFNKDIDFTVLGDEVLDVKETFLRDRNEDVSISEMLFLPDYVNQQINSVFYSLLIAIGVVMVVVLIGIGFRNSLLIIITIPVIVFGTVGVLFLANQELHKLTIVGLIVAIGIMVDNSIVITESIKHQIDRGVPRMEAGKEAIRMNLAPILSSTLTTIAAFIVIVLLPGFLGNIVRSMPLTVIIALSLSFLVSMIFGPIVAALFLRKSKVEKPPVSIHETRIRKMIRNTIQWPFIWMLLSFAALAVTAYITFTTLPIDLYPNDDRAILYIDYENEILGDLASTQDLKDEIESMLLEEPSLKHITSSVGGSLPHFHFSATRLSALPQYGRVFATFDMTERELLEYKERLDEQLDLLDGVSITTHLIELSPPEPPLRMTIANDNIRDITPLDQALLEDIRALDSVERATLTSSVSSISYRITYNEDTIRNNYLTQVEVDSVIATTLNGYQFKGFTYNDQIIDIRLYTPLASINDLLTFTVYSSTLDQYIPLSSLIQITMVTDYSVITRNNNDVVATIDLYPADGVSLRELEQDVNDILDTYNTSRVTISFGGENQLFEDISDDLIRAAIIALILIFIILFVQFNNFLKPLIILFTIPLSFTGSFLFLILFDIPITATALIGMVSLMGVTVNTGILLVEYITKHEENYGVKDACVEAVIDRFRPIMLTSFTTILGLIPLLISGGSFFQPLAITFMGGMVTSTLITIFLVPSVYTFFYRHKRA